MSEGRSDFMEKNRVKDFKNVIESKQELVVHAVRIAVKVGIIVALFIGDTSFKVPLSLYVLASEAFDQFLLLISKKFSVIKQVFPFTYSVNSVLLITIVAYFAKWSLNDFYLIYLVHISSQTVGFGVKPGLLSFILSIVSYGGLLLFIKADWSFFIRFPLISVLVLRLFISQYRYQKTTKFLENVLTVEKSKQDFIALASHNLRTPVSAIYGYLDLLFRGDAGKLSVEQSLFLQRIKGNNQELEKITEQLLQISILEVGNETHLLKQPSQIERVVQDVVDKLQPMAESKKIVIIFQKDSKLLPLVNIDVEKIRSVINNLIDNAIKYTEKGQIMVTSRQIDDFIEITVADTGIGIPKEDLPKLFNKFFRSGNVLVYNKIGIGLGLYISRQVVELHGGKVSVESEENVGTKFSFTLPIAKEEGI